MSYRRIAAIVVRRRARGRPGRGPPRAIRAASTAASSGPLSAPVSASRSACRSPPTALSSRTIARPSSCESRSGGRRAELDEALERRRRVRAELDGSGVEHETRVVARLDERASAPKRGDDVDRRVGSRRELVVGHRCDRVHGEPPKPREIEVDVVLGQAELVQVGANRRRRESLVAKIRDRRVAMPLRELLPVLVRGRARGGSPPAGAHRERVAIARLHGKVRPMVVPADDVRDPERRDRPPRTRAGTSRCRPPGASVVPPSDRRTDPSSSRSALPEPTRPLGGRGVERAALALPHRPLVERDAEPGEVVEDRLLPALDRAARIRVVDPQHERRRRARRQSAGWRRQ